MSELSDFCLQLPKIELHAHINGSLSPATMRELVDKKKDKKPELLEFRIPETLEIEEFFPLFKFIYQLTDDEESVTIATRNVIREFAADGVKYLELRTTPRKDIESGMTKVSYLEAVTRVIQEPRNDDMIVKLIVSIDRRNNLEEAHEVVDLALQFRSKGVVGIDLCGDVTQGSFDALKPAFIRAQEEGFKVTLHFNEIPENVKEAPSLLSIKPDRLGHATLLDDFCRETIYKHNIPVEVCMTSNVLCNTVKTFEEHHLKDLLKDNHPFIICTDDKGVFFSDSSNEYKLAAEAFNLSKDELFKISLSSIDAIFSGDDVKEELKEKWSQWRNNNESLFN